MRMEELSEHRSVKRADTVEAYLLNLVRDYFSGTTEAPNNSMEQIIQKSVERMKDEIDFDSIGVISIQLPNDEQPRTGSVTITLEELGGEPRITDKKQAFNVDFGTMAGTACEGNDERLSDKRNPLPHKHEIEDINGLEGKLSSIAGEAQRAASGIHTHDNKAVLDKLKYSGSKAVIDLGELESLEADIRNLVDSVKQYCTSYGSQVSTGVNQVKQYADSVKAKMDTLKQTVTSQNDTYLQNLKNDVDTKVSAASSSFDTKLAGYLKASDISSLTGTVTSAYVLAGKMEIEINGPGMFTISGGTGYQKKTLNVSQSIMDILDENSQTLQDCIFEYDLHYTKDGKKVYQSMPYVIMNETTLKGVLKAGTDTTSGKIVMELDSTGSVPELSDATLEYRVLSRKEVT